MCKDNVLFKLPQCLDGLKCFILLFFPIWSNACLFWCETIWIQPLCTLSGLDVLCIIFYLNLYKYVHEFYNVKCVFIVNIKNNDIEQLTGEHLFMNA